jgi:hypothetical protein
MNFSRERESSETSLANPEGASKITHKTLFTLLGEKSALDAIADDPTMSF